jgi:hypothetical protein
MSFWTNMFIDLSWRDGYVNGFHEAESWQISDSQSRKTSLQHSIAAKIVMRS